MAGRERMRLTDAAIARLRPREREYTVWDSRVPGLGVRVRPSGGRSYVPVAGGRWPTRNASRSAGGVPEERSTRSAGSAMRWRSGKNPAAGKAWPMHAPSRLFRDFVAGAWKKPISTATSLRREKGVRSAVLASRILPAFGSKPLDRITLRHRSGAGSMTYSGIRPGPCKQSSLGVFRQIMNFAVACGHIEHQPGARASNGTGESPASTHAIPVAGRRSPACTRPWMMHARKDSSRQQADIIRLLLLTGCRKREIVQLCWSEIACQRPDHVGRQQDGAEKGSAQYASQAHPGPASREAGALSCFRRRCDPSRARGLELALWYRVRREAGIEDVRLHDLRHTHLRATR